MFDEINDFQRRIARSTTDRSLFVASELKAHIRSFYREKLHLKKYKHMNVTSLRGMPEYQDNVIRSIDERLMTIQSDSQNKVMQYYEVIGNVLDGLEKHAIPFLVSYMPKTAADIINKIFNFIVKIVRHLISDRIGGSISPLTRLFIRHFAKPDLNSLISNPTERTKSYYDADDDILGDNDTFLSIITDMSSNVFDLVTFITTLVGGDKPKKEAKIKEEDDENDEVEETKDVASDVIATF